MISVGDFLESLVTIMNNYVYGYQCPIRNQQYHLNITRM